MHEDRISLDRDRDDNDAAPSTEVFRLALGPFGARALPVLRVRGREALSRPYAWEVTFTTADPSFDADAAIGQPARLTIAPLAETPREVLGVVASVESCAGIEVGRRAFRVRLVPRFALLKQRRTSRVFEGSTVPEILAAVLDAAGVAHRFETRAEYAPRAYCVQYRETDLGFVRRLCAEVGIWFRFDAPEKSDARHAAEVVTFGDSDAAPELDGGARLAVQSLGGALRGEDTHVTDFQKRRAITSAAIHMRGYEFRRPEAPLEARARLGAGDAAEVLGVYEHHDPDEDAHDAEGGLAGAFLEQLTRGAASARGASVCPRLAPGRRFTLDTSADAGDPGAQVVTAIRHEGRAPRLAGDAPTYENRFDCVPASVVPRPPRPRRKVQTVTETAIVVGPSGVGGQSPARPGEAPHVQETSEIHTDEHGRIRVRFHWQEGRARGDHAACWVRVAESWAGASWGSQFVPRVGMEVLVSFLGGNASRPVVLGCLRNATHPAPFALPRDKATSGIRTRSTPGGEGYSELSFNDTKGSEMVCVRAERDLATFVQHDAMGYVAHDQTSVVRHDRHTTIGAVDTLEIGDRLSIEVAGSARQDMTDDTIAHATGGGAGMTLSGGNASLKTKGNISLDAGGDVSISAAGNITIKAAGTIVIDASGSLSIIGATVSADAGGAIVVTGGTVDVN